MSYSFMDFTIYKTRALRAPVSGKAKPTMKVSYPIDDLDLESISAHTWAESLHTAMANIQLNPSDHGHIDSPSSPLEAETSGSGLIPCSAGNSSTVDGPQAMAGSAPEPTPQWSENHSWASDLDNINIQCISDLGAAFQVCQEEINQVSSSSQDESEEDETWKQKIREAFGNLRTIADLLIDECEESALLVVERQIPAELRNEAATWFTKGMTVVMNLFAWMNEAIGDMLDALRTRMRRAWFAILLAMSSGLTTRAFIAAQGVRRLQVCNDHDGNDVGAIGDVSSVLEEVQDTREVVGVEVQDTRELVGNEVVVRSDVNNGAGARMRSALIRMLQK